MPFKHLFHVKVNENTQTQCRKINVLKSFIIKVQSMILSVGYANSRVSCATLLKWKSRL